MKHNVTPDEALEIILQEVGVLEAEPPAGTPAEQLEAALGRVLARDVRAPGHLPPFDNSAMDGYAVTAADLAAAREDAPVTLPLLETVAAGGVAAQRVRPGTCTKIMTGAPLPEGADAVVMREETRPGDGKVEFLYPAQPGQNIRRAGSDVRAGESVIPAGTLVGPAQWSMLAGLGLYDTPLHRRPRVGILVTGEELAAPGAPLHPGQIRESNSYALRAFARECGAEVLECRRTGDSAAALASEMRRLAPGCDAIITSGGVSAGDFDPVRDVLRDQATVHFWKVAMKPGKPVMFASFEGKPVFGLPGNPVSVMVSFELFVRPALWKMAGRHAWNRPTLTVRLATPLRSPAGRTEFVRARLTPDGAGWRAVFAGDQSSGRLSTMLGAQALLEIPPQVTELPAGAPATARLMSLPDVD